MKQAIYNYLREELYPLPLCDTCQYSDPQCKRIPCDTCDLWERWKLHKGHEADLRRMVREIVRIVEQNKTK